jgi:phosphoenolpyruvate-protein kinase (PTS system EI component)
MLAVDRTNEQISDLYVAYHPAVLRALSRIAEAARRQNKPLSMCGDMAGDPRLLPFLLGIGLRVFSVAPRWLPQLQDRIAHIRIADAEAQARTMLEMGRVSDLTILLNRQAAPA